ncbi:MAG: SRPBCC domain-containing protein [Paracoccaceae bacterium]
MRLSGLIRTTCPPDQLMALLSDPTVLAAMMPSGTELSQTGPDTYAFVVRKSLGPVTLTMPGTLTLIAVGDGHDRKLVAHARHKIGGKADLELVLTATVLGTTTMLDYQCWLTATGLAHRMLGENAERV